MHDYELYMNHEAYLRSYAGLYNSPGILSYTISNGDTLKEIASQFKTTIELVLQVNPGLDPNWLAAGQQISIPVNLSEKWAVPVSQIAKKASPYIVGIKVIAKNSQGQFSIIEGSGIIINKDGYIVTNKHLVEDAGPGNKNADLEILLFDQRRAKAKLIGSDALYDLAVIKIELDNLPVAPLGDSSKIETDELAIVVGNPKGLKAMGVITAGVIKEYRHRIFHESLLTYIQTDAVINQGNSGGALINKDGIVIGINIWGVPIEDGYDSVGLAIPTNTARTIIDRLIASVKDKLDLGIKIEENSKSSKCKKKLSIGICIAKVDNKSIAANAGLQKDDILISMADKPVNTKNDYDEIQKDFKVGDVVEVAIVRGKKIHKYKLIYIKENKTSKKVKNITPP